MMLRLLTHFMALSLLVNVSVARADGKPAAVLHGCGGIAVAYSRDGSRLLTASEDGARVWDTRTFRPLTPMLQHGQKITQAQLSADGSRVLTSDGVSAQSWDVATGKSLGPRLRPDSSGGIIAVISPDGRTALTGSSRPVGATFPQAREEDSLATLWDLATGKVVARLPHECFVPLAAFSPDGSRIVTVSPARNPKGVEQAYLWDAATGREVTRIKSDAAANIAFSADGRRFAVAMYYSVGIFDSASGDRVAIIHDFEREHLPDAVALSGDGSRVASHEQFGGTRLWAVNTNQQIGPMVKNVVGMRQVVLSPDASKVFVNITEDNTAGVFFTSKAKNILRIPAERCDVGAFSPDGKQLAAGAGYAHCTDIWSVPDGE